ncbi:chymotrypsin-like protease CTRL-1 [Drosophila eugracilis]|uniref:chymotrypsin-like protease CTRL-1 n=1 Tax=Drosophila eugracilis TaxID=29029 RepID=UPI001BDA538E|nr:chymotrypsin-like protease CTRL-1 [Drosophila eugracilis]
MMLSKDLLAVSLILILSKLGSTQLLDNKCKPPLFSPRIVGGKKAERAPWMAILSLNGKNICGGSLITNGSNVILGEYDTSTIWDGPTKKCGVKYVIIHPYYTKGLSNDIALLKLDQSVQYTANIRPICILLKPNQRSVIDSMQSFILTGWGKTNADQQKRTTKLKQLSLRRYDQGCRNLKDTFCAYTPRQSACYGDSGSPLGAHVRDHGITFFAQFGIASQVSSKTCEGFSYYTDVYYHASWIYEVIRSYWYY